MTKTFLFTDLAIMTRLGEPRADELRREHFGSSGSAAEERGGREVKNTGDGLM